VGDVAGRDAIRDQIWVFRRGAWHIDAIAQNTARCASLDD